MVRDIKKKWDIIIMKLEFQEKIVPGDGNCLFHSMGLAFNLPQGDLRLAIALYLEKNRKMKINGMTLEEWLVLEKDMPLDRYCNLIRRDGIWGGNMEIDVATKMFKSNIFVLMKDAVKKKYNMVSSYVFDNDARNVFLIYDGVHYNYLKVSKNMAGIKT